MFLIPLCCSLIGNSQNIDNFEKANTFYASGDYNSAVKLYEDVLDEGFHSYEVYFNLANSYYKLNKIGPCIYNYEKALILSPNDYDALKNLGFAKKMITTKIDEIPIPGSQKLLNNITNMISLNKWGVLCISFMLLFVYMFILYYLSFSTFKKRLFFILASFSLSLTIFSFAMAYIKLQKKDNEKYGIIYAQKINVKLNPKATSETIFSISEGNKVQIIKSSQDSWKKVRLSDGRVGWILKNSFKLL